MNQEAIYVNETNWWCNLNENGFSLDESETCSSDLIWTEKHRFEGVDL